MPTWVKLLINPFHTCIGLPVSFFARPSMMTVACVHVVALFPDSTPQIFITHGAIKSWGVESGNEAIHVVGFTKTSECPRA